MNLKSLIDRSESDPIERLASRLRELAEAVRVMAHEIDTHFSALQTKVERIESAQQQIDGQAIALVVGHRIDSARDAIIDEMKRAIPPPVSLAGLHPKLQEVEAKIDRLTRISSDFAVTLQSAKTQGKPTKAPARRGRR